MSTEEQPHPPYPTGAPAEGDKSGSAVFCNLKLDWICEFPASTGPEGHTWTPG